MSTLLIEAVRTGARPNIGPYGIPLPVPDTYGFEVQRKLERYVERESKRFDDAVAAFLKEKDRRRAARPPPKG